jgi:hypothetical protein
MQTNDLIARLATDLRPVPPGAVLKRIGLGVSVGAVFALGALLMALGTDLSDAIHTNAFWMKWGYGIAVSGIALWLCLRLARPERVSGALLLALAIPVLALTIGSIQELTTTSPEARMRTWLGSSAPVCPWIVGALSVPIFAGLLWAFRRFAPTRPRLAGFSAGALSGAVAVLLYSIHCPETAVSFVATWYTLGMLLPAVVGSLIGPRALRW